MMQTYNRKWKEYGADVILPACFLLFLRGLYYLCTQKIELSKL